MKPAGPAKPCAAEGCLNSAPPARRLCNACKYKREKELDPVRPAWHRLTSRARDRGIFCDLTLEQFRAECYALELLVGRGRTALSFTVDRVIEELGYTAGNLQRLTNRANVLKEHARRRRVKWVSRFDEYGDPTVIVGPDGKKKVPGRVRVVDEYDEPESTAQAFDEPPF